LTGVDQYVLAQAEHVLVPRLGHGQALVQHQLGVVQAGAAGGLDQKLVEALGEGRIVAIAQRG
jgi:hypothetical protein